MRLAILFRVALDLFVGAVFFLFAIVAGSDSTSLFADTNRRIEADLKVLVIAGIGLSLLAAALAINRVWANTDLRWPKAEVLLALSFPVWLGVTMLAART